MPPVLRMGAHMKSHTNFRISCTWLYKAFGDAFSGIYHWENIIFAFVALTFLCVVSTTVARKRKMVPGRLQSLVELVVEGLYNFFHSMLGDHARRYTPFLGTLFVYILTMNWMGMFPFLKAPSSAATITVSLALIVFVYSQAVGFKHLGIGGWFFHLMGSPRDVIGWCLVPLNLPIHVIGEFAKPLSLSLRLFGNITGEDISDRRLYRRRYHDALLYAFARWCTAAVAVLFPRPADVHHSGAGIYFVVGNLYRHDVAARRTR